MNAKENARRIIERYFPQFLPIRGMVEHDLGVEVEHDLGVEGKAMYWYWYVSPMSRINGAKLSPGYQLYGVDSGGLAAACDGGVAVLPDGRMFHLNDTDDFRAFFAAARTLLSPFDVVALLASFQSEAGPHENVLWAPREKLVEARNHHLSHEQFAALPLTAPEVTGWGEAAAQICFTTMCIEGPDHGPPTLGFHRWHVQAGKDGDLAWHADPIARGVRSRVYGGNP